MNQSKTVYQVSQLTDEMRRLMELSYPEIWIEGELSSLSTPASGHLYFSLKDEKSQLRCAMFKGRASINRYKPKAGDLVRVRAKISVYSARGDLQCIVQHVEEAGEGILQRRYEELKNSLNAQGLFSQEHKQKLPSYAKHIGIVTSPSGAAVRDIISTLKRRCPGIPVTIYPAVVQGDTAAKSIISAIKDAVQHQQADVLIVSRGGGSLEDLWCFNHEELAHEIYRCPIPIVSGVGHEVDVTIADLVADLRAPTPTAAAELVSPNTEQLTSQLDGMMFRLPRSFERLVQRKAQQVDMAAKQLVHPKKQLQINQNKLAQASKRFELRIQTILKQQKQSISNQSKRLKSHSPLKAIQHKNLVTNSLSDRLHRSKRQNIESNHQKLANLASQLNLVSPLATMERGFSIAKNKNGDIIRTASQTQKGDNIELALAKGLLSCTVNEVKS